MKTLWNKIVSAFARQFAGIVASKYDGLAAFTGNKTIGEMVAMAQAKARAMIEGAENLRAEAGSIRSDADKKLQAAILAARSQYETETAIANAKLANAAVAVAEANAALGSAEFLLGK